MQRNLIIGVLFIALLSGCGTTAMDSESTREVVLQYLGADATVGTAGPFAKSAKREVDVLSAANRRQAEALIDQGAVLFLVYGQANARPVTNDSTDASPKVGRVILVQGKRVVGDFRAEPKPSSP